MGSHRVCSLEFDRNGNLYDGASLWTRGGLSGVYVAVDDKEVHIPAEIIRILIGEEYVKQRINRLEQMTTDQAIDEMMGFKTV